MPPRVYYRLLFRDDVTGLHIRRMASGRTVQEAQRTAESSPALRGKWLKLVAARLATTQEIRKHKRML